MTINKLKSILYGRTVEYWSGADVVWGATNIVKPSDPLVVLRLGTVNRVSQPVTQMIKGVAYSAYPSETSLQVDLFTRGALVKRRGVEYYENAATNDMLDFLNFIDSISSAEFSGKNDISVSVLNGVQDLSEIVNDSQWRYRAMVELRIAFTQWTAEYNGALSEDSIIFDADGIPTGVNPAKWKQTSSGGGSKKLAKESTNAFDEVEIKYDLETGGNRIE